MTNIIDKSALFKRKHKHSLVSRCAAHGMTGQEIEVWAEIYDAFFESEEALTARLDAEERDRRTIIRNRMIPTENNTVIVNLDNAQGIFFLVRSARAVAEEMHKTVRLRVPLIVSNDIPQQGWFEHDVSSTTVTADVCTALHRKEEVVLLEYLDSPQGRRMALAEANRPGDGKTNWADIADYLSTRVAPT